jgi:hypothetical protein
VKPLGRTERKLVLLVELYRRQHGVGPSWTLLGRSLGVERLKLYYVLSGLRAKGALEWRDGWEGRGSISATPAGVRAALQRFPQ